ncbi:probable BOI-related E3 ubiquitin-protein ligase 3 [Syzygium oleosum]|uniref:probable BOI-related E3 ubiquitin-protein ligase 3 n=1 Tax=Syzygium oleosum TaxID=219896 RepID=UPI0011D1ED11|nr:probable BOI-related E3 ubiquitin-protein ligase 3 [Syzygium oleosum]
MAIQAQLYPGNNVGVGLPPWGSSQGYGVAANHNGCGYDYGFSGMKQREQQQLQLELFLQQQLQNHDQRSNGNWCFDNTSLVTAPEDGAYKNNHLSINDMVQAAAPIAAAAAASSSSSYSQSLPFQLDPHGQEIDHLLRLQNERLRWLVHEQSKRQIESMTRKIELRVQILLRQKDEEIAQAARKAAELEELLRRLEVEGQEWQRVARENEAMAASLSNALEQLKDSACCRTSSSCSSNGNVGEDDAESCCHVMTNTNPNRESGKPGTGEDGAGICRNCNARESSVLFMPCRHIGCCMVCEPLLGSCPVCRMVKKASEAVLFF